MQREYLTSRILNSNSAQLVALLYETMIKNLDECIISTDDYMIKSLVDKNKDILAHLIATVQGDSKIASNYKSIYMYINTLMTEYQIKKDVSKLSECKNILMPLYESWNQLGNQIFQEEGVSAKTSIKSGLTYGKNSLNDYISCENEWDKG